jgi:aspartyl-tRNA(Asn)/glutamyl-tRNA(Gln) amidotransferase subunit A
MLDVLCGPDPRDHTRLDRSERSFSTTLQAPFAADGLRAIAYSRTLGHAQVDPEIAHIIDRAAAHLSEAVGLPLREVEPSWGSVGPELGRFFWAAHLTRLLGALVQWRGSMDPGLVACIEEGATYSLATYQEYRARKYAYCAEVSQTLEEHGYLLTPLCQSPPFLLGYCGPQTGRSIRITPGTGWTGHSSRTRLTSSVHLRPPLCVE